MFSLGINLVTGLISWCLWVFMFVIAACALVDASVRRVDAFPAVDRLTKRTWLVILGIGGAFVFLSAPRPFGVIPIFNIFNMAAMVAAGAYLVDVRPKIKAITSR